MKWIQQEVGRSINQDKQEVEVTDYHSHIDQRATVADTTVDPKQEQVGVQNIVVSSQPVEISKNKPLLLSLMYMTR